MNYKKIDFSSYAEAYADKKLLKAISKIVAKQEKEAFIKSFAFAILLIVGGLVGFKWVDESFTFAILAGMVVGIYSIIKLLYTLFPQVKTKTYLAGLIMNDYTSKLPIIPKPQDENVFTVIDFVTAKSKYGLISEAFRKKADALIEPNTQIYSTTKTYRDNSSSTTTHENWTATAVKFNTTQYHKKFYIVK